jgi:putative FmdB family regulatory protein
MPIYAYRCASCGYQKDVLQKMSDALLTICPECKADSFRKQVTAAGFQLKGNGWYATDFKNGGQTAKAAETTSTATTPAAPATTATESKPATPAATSAPGSGTTSAST